VEIMLWLALAIESHLAPRLRKEYNYTPTAILGNLGLFYFEHCLLLARKVKSSLLQYIM